MFDLGSMRSVIGLQGVSRDATRAGLVARLRFVDSREAWKGKDGGGGEVAAP